MIAKSPPNARETAFRARIPQKWEPVLRSEYAQADSQEQFRRWPEMRLRQSRQNLDVPPR
jgi:hypothetical protein